MQALLEILWKFINYDKDTSEALCGCSQKDIAGTSRKTVAVLLGDSLRVVWLVLGLLKKACKMPKTAGSQAAKIDIESLLVKIACWLWQEKGGGE